MCYKSHNKRVSNNCNLALITQTKNLSNNVKKSSNTGQDEETLLSIFMSFLTTSTKVQFWKMDLLLGSSSTHFWNFTNIS